MKFITPTLPLLTLLAALAPSALATPTPDGGIMARDVCPPGYPSFCRKTGSSCKDSNGVHEFCSCDRTNVVSVTDSCFEQLTDRDWSDLTFWIIGEVQGWQVDRREGLSGWQHALHCEGRWSEGGVHLRPSTSLRVSVGDVARDNSTLSNGGVGG